MSREGIFPTFFLSGFECSTFVWKDQGRRDLCEETQHRGHSDEDYRMLRSLGIGVAREGIPWPLVDKGGGVYDFSYIDPFLQAQRRYRILPIWDLCHYGYPDGLDPFGDDFAPRFAAYAAAAARYVGDRAHHGPLCFTPMNEPTFFGYMAGEWAWAAPFGRDRDTRRVDGRRDRPGTGPLSDAGVTRLFVGLGRRFQIWEPGAYERSSAEKIERAKALTLPAGRSAP